MEKYNMNCLMGSLGCFSACLFTISFWLFFNFNDDDIIGKLMMVLIIISGMFGLLLLIRSEVINGIQLSRYDKLTESN